MTNKARNTSGKFAPKSETPRKIRSVNLTDDAWQWLADVAAQAGVSRNDYLEALADGATPLMETVSSDKIETTEQPENNVFPLMETVNNALTPTSGHLYQEIEKLKERNRLLIIKNREERQKLEEELAALKYRDESQSRRLQEKHALEIQVEELQSQLETERADRQEVERQLSELQQNSAPAATLSEKPTPDAATILSQLRTKRKKSSATLADVEKILEILEGDDER